MMDRFSKPLGDVSPEAERILREESAHLDRERRVSSLLATGEMRISCAVCAGSLGAAAEAFHRGASYLLCSGCGHFQSSRLPSQEHREALSRMNPFHSIYPDQKPDDFQSRVERVYRPKLEWILDSAVENGLNRQEMLGRKWMELGCGAGYFLKALLDAGALRIEGLDQDGHLAKTANRILGGDRACHFTGALPEAIRKSDSDVYAAFFVLEHVENITDIMIALKEKPKGTLFCFSVPVLGLGAMLESGFDHFFARNLDNGVHTQLFTDRSLSHLLDMAGYTMVSRWVFGQDVSDFIRMMIGRLGPLYPGEMLEALRKSLRGMQDDLQGVLDRGFLADSRHILAIRR